MKCNDILLAWLNNAYSMERAIERTLEGHAEDAQSMPDVQSKIREHIDQTQSQAERVKDAIERLGGGVSKLKEGMADVMGYMQGIATDISDDKVVKNAIAEHATEHFEMATYMSIAKAAEICGEDDVKMMAEEIMREEMEMGKQLEKDLPMVVESYMRMKMEE